MDADQTIAIIGNALAPRQVHQLLKQGFQQDEIVNAYFDQTLDALVAQLTPAVSLGYMSTITTSSYPFPSADSHLIAAAAAGRQGCELGCARLAPRGTATVGHHLCSLPCWNVRRRLGQRRGRCRQR